MKSGAPAPGQTSGRLESADQPPTWPSYDAAIADFSGPKSGPLTFRGLFPTAQEESTEPHSREVETNLALQCVFRLMTTPSSHNRPSRYETTLGEQVLMEA